jgi:predicted nucleic acid-binding protein
MTTTDGPAFMLDSNVLVYSVDSSEPEKQRVAQRVLAELRESNRGAICTQVLGEYFRVSTRKIQAPLARAQAERSLTLFSSAFPVFETTLDVILDGARASGLHQLYIWDAVIWATARLNGMRYLLSEDMGNGRNIEGVTIINPFAINFDMGLLR